MQSRKALRFAIFASLTLSLILSACTAHDTQDKSSNGSAADATGHSSAPTENKAANTDIDNTAIPFDPPVHIHKFSAATCTSPRICACGETAGTATDHNYAAATCSAPKTCSFCGATEGTALEHSWVDATYSAPRTCSACGMTEGDPADVPGKINYHGHVYTGGSSSKKYHYEAACPGKNSHEITWDEVTSRGLEPCGTCVLK